MSAVERNLFGFGHAIASDLAVPGALPASAELHGADEPLSILRNPPRSSVSDAIYHRDGNALWFSPPGVGQYRCSHSRIEVSPDPHGDPQALTELLIATALPAVQWLRGHFVLHAAGVILPGHSSAIAICGASGSGKSTAAAALLERGAKLVGDDTLRLANRATGWSAAGLPGGLFRSEPNRTERRFQSVAPPCAVPEAQLSAIVVLGERSAVPSLQALDGVAALGQLLAMQHRPRVPAILGRYAEVLQMAAGIIRFLPVFAWHRRSDSAELDDSEFDMLQHCCGNQG